MDRSLFPRYFIIALALYALVFAAGMSFIVDVLRYGIFGGVFALITLTFFLPLILLVPYVKWWPRMAMRLVISFIVVADALFLLIFVLPAY